MHVLQLSAVAQIAPATPRTISGVAMTYGDHADASTGPVIFETGAVHWAEDLRRVKLLVDHDQAQPVGYATSIEDDGTQVTVTFHVPESPAGDVALAQAANGLRDGLSVGVYLDAGGYSWDEDGTLHVSSGTLREVTLCALPALDHARVSDVAATRPTPPPSTTQEGNTVPETPTAPAVEASTPPAPPVETSAPAAPVAAATAPRTPATAAPRGLSLAQGVRHLAEVIRRTGDPGAVNAALADIVPADDAGEGFMRPQWLGELWTPLYSRRRLIESIQRANLTSGTKVYGWKWDERPEVDDYLGNKTEIPTNPVSIVPAEAPVERTAGGWDVDRIFIDLGEAGFLEALFRAATEDYLMKSEAKVAAGLLTGAGAAITGPTTLIEGLNAAAVDLTSNGAEASFFAFSPDLWGDYLAMTGDTAPWWLARSSSLSIRDTETTVADVNAWAEPSLPAGTILAGDRRAATFYEPSGASPLRVQAVNIPQGGVDIAVFGYHGLIVNDARGLSRVTVTEA